MANGDVRKINDSRISIEVDNISYVIDIEKGQEQVEVVAAFMAKWSEKHARDKKVIAATEARRRREASEARKAAIDAVMDLSDEEVEILATPAAAIKFSFPGFEDVPEMPQKKEEAKKDADPKPDRSGRSVPRGRKQPDDKLGADASGS